MGVGAGRGRLPSASSVSMVSAMRGVVLTAHGFRRLAMWVCACLHML